MCSCATQIVVWTSGSRPLFSLVAALLRWLRHSFMIKICTGQCAAQPDIANGNIHATQPKAKEGLSVEGPDPQSPYGEKSHVHIAAIDNSLSWPVYHPNSWRSYSYGWLYLPSSLIGLPFSTLR